MDAQELFSMVKISAFWAMMLCSLVDKVKVKFSVEQAMKAQRGSTGIALFFL